MNFDIADRVYTRDGRSAAVQFWGKPGAREPVRASRTGALRSGQPYLYLWFGGDDCAWVPAGDVSRSKPISDEVGRAAVHIAAALGIESEPDEAGFELPAAKTSMSMGASTLRLLKALQETRKVEPDLEGGPNSLDNYIGHGHGWADGRRS